MKTFSRLLFFIVLFVLVASFIGCDGLTSPPSGSDNTSEQNNESSNDSGNDNAYVLTDDELLATSFAIEFAYLQVQSEILAKLNADSDVSSPVNSTGQFTGEGYSSQYEIALEEPFHEFSTLTIDFDDYNASLDEDLLASYLFHLGFPDASIYGNYLINGTFSSLSTEFSFSAEEVDGFLIEFQGTVESTNFGAIMNVEVISTVSETSYIINDTNYYDRLSELRGFNSYVPTEEEIIVSLSAILPTMQSRISTIPDEVVQVIIDSEGGTVAGTYNEDYYSFDYEFYVDIEEPGVQNITDFQLAYYLIDYPVDIEASSLNTLLPDYDFSSFPDTFTCFLNGEIGGDNNSKEYYFDITVHSELFGGDIHIELDNAIYDDGLPAEVYVNGIDYSDRYEELTTVD
jgi:hypothetical protein